MIPLYDEDWSEADMNHPIRRHRIEAFVSVDETPWEMRHTLDELLTYFDVDARQRQLRALEYRTGYLNSEHWKIVRRQALQAASYRCQHCAKSERLDVHHRTYERLGAEEPGDLEVLCRSCHEQEHEQEAS